MSALQLYFKDKFLYDLKAGFITAVVALPLAIAFAIASGVHPIMGIYTAIIAGILGSTLGGSSFSITGPTGAMTVIILSTVNKFGVEGLLIAGFLAGVIQIVLGAIRLGRFVQFIPFPIVSGFTAGIGVIIFIGQIANSLGIVVASKEHIWELVWEIIQNIPHANLLAISITLLTILSLVFLPKILPKIKYLKNVPPSIIPLLLATAAAFFFHLSIPQVGDIPSGLPSFKMLNINLKLIMAVLPAAFTIALLGAIEALLCAVVCDGMTNTKHKSDKELISQGVCNTLLPFLGGIPCTAAIARSAVNIREGAKTRMAGIIHGIILLLVLLFLSPVAQYIPKAFLAGVLMFVAVKMINIHEFKTIIKISRAETIVLFITFGMTIFTDLVLAVEVGMVLAIFLLFIRLSNIIDISSMEDYKDHTGINAMVFSNPTLKDVVSVYTLHGPFFFGAMNLFDKKAKEHMGNGKPVMILRMKYVPFIDSTGLIRLNDFIKEKQKNKMVVMLTDMSPAVHKTLKENSEFKHLMKNEYIFEKTKEALHYVENNLHSILLLR
ncbi:MAG: SulP family inorganic anion transporter [Nanoarchaeota archaeon]|nr:SulP family inorganic anion transporter [Nanoarchaeota archaeon]